jgi:uncharacterized membrane protein YqaE (UPF0057 family)
MGKALEGMKRQARRRRERRAERREQREANRNQQRQDALEQRIDNMEWTLFDRFLYGGLGYGYFSLPTNLLRIILTVIFPPLAIIIKALKLSYTFPFITMETITSLIDNFGEILYSFVLTALFYIPGLIYGLSKLKCDELAGADEDFKDVTMNDIKEHFNEIKKTVKNN